jgi:hypothetical protein
MVEPVADPQLPGFLHQFLDEGVMDILVDVETLGRNADLAAIHVGRERRRPGSDVQRRRRHDDERIVARSLDQ